MAKSVRWLRNFVLTAMALVGPVLSSSIALAVTSSGITYHGRILRPDGSPAQGVQTQFKIQIRSPGNENCLLFEEIQSVNMAGSSGIFSLTINDGSGQRTDTNSYGLDALLANRGSFNFASGVCTSGLTYTPNTADGRALVVLFRDENMANWEALPTQSVNFAPLAIEAKQVGGFGPNNLLRVDDNAASSNTTPLTLAHLTELSALIGGTSTKYMKVGSSGGASLPVLGAAPSPLTAGTIWYEGGVVKFTDGTSSYTLGAGGGTGTVTAVTVGSGLVDGSGNTGTVISTTGTIALPSVGSVGTYFKVTTDAQGRVASGTASLAETDIPTLTSAGKVSGDTITSGTIGGSTVINTTGAITTTGALTAASLSSTTDSTQSLRVWDGVSKYVQFTAPVGLANNYGLVLPGALPALNGQVLTSDTSGNLSWTTPSAGSVTSVGVTSPILNSGTASAPVIAIQQANGSQDGYLSSGDWNTFNSKLGTSLASGNLWVGNGGGTATAVAPSGDVTMTNAGAFAVTKIQGTAVSATVPTTAGQVLRYDGTSTYVPAALAIADVTGLSTALTAKIDSSQMPANCSSNQTLTFVSPTGSWTCSSITVTGSAFGSQTQNLVFAAPDGSAGNPTFRALVAADIPALDAAKITTGTLGVARLPTVTVPYGGTGLTTVATNSLLYGNGAGDMNVLAPTNSAVLTSSAGGAPQWSLLNADTFTQYALLAGRAGGQSLTGGSAASENLTLESTSHATKGNVLLVTGGGNVGVGTTTPGARLEVSSGVANTSGLKFTNFTSTAPTTAGQPVGVDASGNLVTVSVSGSGTVNSGTQNQLAYYGANGTAVSGLATANNGVLVTDGSGVPSIAATLPSAVQGNITGLGTVTSGTWNGTAVGAQYGGTGLNAAAAANGQLLIGNGGGFTLAGITGTANQLSVTNGAGSITLALPQDVHAGASPTFTGLTLSGMSSAGIVKNTAGGVLSGGNTVNLAADVSGTLGAANGGTGVTSLATNSLLYGNGTGAMNALAPTNSAVLTSSAGGAPQWSLLSADSFTQYALLAGRAGGQSLTGGTAANDGITIDSTSNATKGAIVLNPGGGNVGIGTTTPGVSLDVGSRTDAIALPSGTTAQQPGTPVGGWTRYNTTNNLIEFYNGTAWTSLSTGTGLTALTGDVTATGPGSAAATVVKVNGVSYPAGPGTNTVPVVTGANTITYQAVPNAALANSSVTLGSTSVSLGATANSLAGLNSVGLGVDGTTTGQAVLANGGVGGASVTVQNNAATAAYNFNLPASAGTSAQVLTSAGGAAAPMTWTTLAPSATTDTTNASNISSGTLGVARLPTVTVPYGGTGLATVATNSLLYGNGVGDMSVLAPTNSAVLTSSAGGVPQWSTLTSDTFTQYALLAGRAGGQSLNGGTAASENLTLDSTVHATKGNVLLAPTGGNVGIGTTTPASSLDVQRTSTATDATYEYGADFTITASPATNSSHIYQAVRGTAKASGYAAGQIDRVAGGYFSGRNQGTGLVYYVAGSRTRAYNETTGSVTDLYGAENIAWNFSTGSVSSPIGSSNSVFNDVGGSMGNAYGTLGQVVNYGSGTYTSATGNGAYVYNQAAGGTITTAVGASVGVSNAGTITDTYGFYIDDVTSGTQTNQAFGLYQADTAARNYFGGNVGIGTTTPASKLDVAGSVKVGADATACSGTIQGAIRLNGTAMEYCNGTAWTAMSAGGSYLSTSGGTLSGALTISSGGASITGGVDNNSGGITEAGSITGVGANITGAGAMTVAAGGTAQNLTLSSSTTGSVNVGSGNGTSLQVQDGGASTVNYITAKGAATGAAPALGVDGADANINLKITPKGTGNTLFTSGNVGIGTTTPGYPLDVSGVIRSGNASDYVTLDGNGARGISISYGNAATAAVQKTSGDTLVFGGGNLNHIYMGINGDPTLAFAGTNVGVGYPASTSLPEQMNVNGNILVGSDSSGGGVTGGIIRAGNHIGGGATNGGPLTLQAGQSNGPNLIGGALTLAGGASSGNANGGSILFNTTPAGASGSTINSAVTAMAVTGDGKVGIGTTTPSAPLSLANTVTSTANSLSASRIDVTVDPSADLTTWAQTRVGETINISTATGAANKSTQIIAGENYVNDGSSKGFWRLVGQQNWAQSYGTGTWTGSGVWGSYNNAFNSNAGATLTDGVWGTIAEGESDAGTVTNVGGVYAWSHVGGGTVSKQVGVHVKVQGSAGTLTNRYGVYIEESGVLVPTNSYGLYQASAGAKNYFAGNVGIGTTTPGVSLDLSIKTDAVALPKGTSAQQPGSPVAGWIRYNTDNNAVEFHNGTAWTTLSTGGGSYLSTSGGTLSGALTISSGGASITGGVDNNSGGITEAGSITGVGANITGAGAMTIAAGGTAQDLTLSSSTTGSVNVGSGNGTSLQVQDGGASTVNYVTVKGAAMGSAPTIASAGADANINLNITPKGTGNTVFTSGNVGIGTTSPGGNLHIMGASPSLRVENTTSTQNAQIELRRTGVNSLWIGPNASGQIDFWSFLNEPIRFASNNVERLRIDASGNVGIGTTLPTAELHVYKTGSNADIRLESSVGSAFMDVFESGSSHGLWGYGSFPMRFATDNVERLRISSSGNVGIGTTTPITTVDVVATNTGVGTAYPNYATSQWGGVSPHYVNSNNITRVSLAPTADTSSGTINSGMTGWVDLPVGSSANTVWNSAGVHGVMTNQSTDVSNASGWAGFSGVLGEYSNNGTNNSVGAGINGQAENDSGFVYQLMGANLSAYQNGGSSSYNLGLYSYAETAGGTTTNLYGGDIEAKVSAGTVTTSYGLYVKNSFTGGSLTNRYGIYLTSMSGTPSTNDFALYIAATQPSYFAGKVGIGTTTPGVSLDLSTKTDAVALPKGTTAQQPGSPVAGWIRYNTDNNAVEFHNGTAWTTLSTGGGSYLSTSGGTLSGALTISSGGASITGGVDNNSGGITEAGSITGVGANLTGAGAMTVAAGGTAQNLTLSSSTTGSVNIGSGNGTSLQVLDGGASTVNYITAKGSATGVAPTLATAGSDTNISLAIMPKGTGGVGIGMTSPIAAMQLGDNASSANPKQFYAAEYKAAGGGRPTFVGNWASTDKWGIGQATATNDNTIRIGNVSNPGNDWAATQNLNLVVGGNVGIGTTSPTYPLHVSSSPTSTSGSVYSNYNVVSPSPGAASTASYFGMTGYSYLNNANSSGAKMQGVYGLSEIGSGALNTATGTGGHVSNAGTGTVANAHGVVGTVANNSTGVITTGIGGYFSVAQPSGTVTNGYGIYVDTIQGTNKFGVYQADSAANNYFAGNVGIGTTNPAATLNVQGGILSLAGSNPIAAVAAPYILAPVATGFSSNPAYSFWYQADTGISNPAASTIGFVTSNNERLRITNAGNVGIGTSAPISWFHFQSPSATTQGWPFLATSPGKNNWSGVWQDSSANMYLQARDGSNNLTANLASSGNSYLTAGNFGVGTNSPSYQLEVSSPISDSAYNGLRVTNSAYTQAGYTMVDFFNSNASANFSSSRIYSQIGSGGTDSKLRFAVADSAKTLQDRMVIDVSGNVGIGTTTPAATLDVAGSVKVGSNASACSGTIQGAIRLNGTAMEYCNGTAWTSMAAGGSYLSTAGGTLSGALTISSGGASVTGGVDNNSGGITEAGSITGVGANITGSGAMTVAAGGTAQNLTLSSSTTGSVNVGSGNGTSLQVQDGGASTVNYISIKGAATGLAPVIGTAGADANIDLKLTPKGIGNTLITSGKVGIGTTSPTSELEVVETGTASTAGYYVTSRAQRTVNPSAAQETGSPGVRNIAVGGTVDVSNSSANSIYKIHAVYGEAINNKAGQSINELVGLSGWAYNQNSGTVGAVTGALATSEVDAGTVSWLDGARIWSGVYGGTVTNWAGVRVDLDSSAGTVTNRYGVFVGAPTGAGTATNDFGFYQAGAQKNYFAGNVGIGTTTPTEKLHVSGGSVVSATQTVSTATVNFNTGNVQVSTNTASSWTICGLGDGGSYSLVLKNVAVGTVLTFSANTSTIAACTGGSALTFDAAGITLRTTSATTILTFIRAGSVVYAMFAPGFTN